jgi:hypothetical protein
LLVHRQQFTGLVDRGLVIALAALRLLSAAFCSRRSSSSCLPDQLSSLDPSNIFCRASDSSSIRSHLIMHTAHRDPLFASLCVTKNELFSFACGEHRLQKNKITLKFDEESASALFKWNRHMPYVDRQAIN